MTVAPRAREVTQPANAGRLHPQVFPPSSRPSPPIWRRATPTTCTQWLSGTWRDMPAVLLARCTLHGMTRRSVLAACCPQRVVLSLAALHPGHPVYTEDCSIIRYSTNKPGATSLTISGPRKVRCSGSPDSGWEWAEIDRCGGHVWDKTDQHNWADADRCWTEFGQ